MPYLSSAQEVPLDFWATQEKVERMGVAAETKTVTYFSNPILRFSSDWNSMNQCITNVMLQCITYIVYQGQNMVVGKIFGDGNISRYVQINLKAILCKTIKK